ncbi:hypothetical protein JI641_09435 [Listeria ivanovii subsp. londoniensis]|uniref:hypothetical protein n=1 Tax=Listeria ivanovii TaxID=1638 RepID=UPI00190876F3|nr:hypothetical protein [Listeria ivanovii]MBK2003216.1 hypothetical protein [Listeria ivanovii subsp. londoniensis]
MKKQRKSNVLKGILGGMIILAPLTTTFSNVATATEMESPEEKVKITNETVKGNTESFTLEMEETDIDFDYTQNDDSFVLKTETTEGEKHTFTYEEGADYAIMDGEKIDMHIENYVDLNQDNLLMANASPWTPKYLSTANISISKQVKTLSNLVTIISGVIAGAGITGIKIAMATISTKVGNWASVVGLTSYGAGKLFTGKIVYKQYRTSGLVPTKYGSKKLYAFRNQDLRSTGTIAGKKMNIQMKNVGDWFFNSKPY